MEKSTTNTLLPDITAWVNEHFKNNPDCEQKGFNVHCYSKKEKEDAVLTLTARGYICLLENNGNHLNITR